MKHNITHTVLPVPTPSSTGKSSRDLAGFTPSSTDKSSRDLADGQCNDTYASSPTSVWDLGYSAPIARPAGKRVLCLWLPNWPIQRLVVQSPALRCQRIVLFRRDSRRGQVVSAASPLAMQAGVCVDMPLSEAKSLLQQTSVLPRTSVHRPAQSGTGHTPFHIFEHDPAGDTAALEQLADSLDGFSPIVGLEPVDSINAKQATRGPSGQQPQALLLDVTGLAHLFGDELQLTQQVLAHCDSLGYLPRLAVANTAAAAWGMARFFAGPFFNQHQQPLLLPPGDRESINQLPVDTLRLPAVTTDTLYQLGIKTIGQLRQLSRRDVATRFGHFIHQRLDQLTGQTDQPIVARRRPPEFQAAQLLEHPTHHRETIEVIIARLITDLCTQLREAQRGALAWSVQLQCQTNEPLEFTVSLFQPTSTIAHIMPLVAMQLETALSPVTRKFRKRGFQKTAAKRAAAKLAKADFAPPNSGAEPAQAGVDESAKATELLSAESQNFHRYTTVQVTEIEVTVASSVLLVQQQRQLFDEDPQLNQQALAHLINRLAGRLGASHVVYPTLLAGAQPEHSFRLRPLVDPNRKRRRQKTRPPKTTHRVSRPLRLFTPARRLEVVQLASDESHSQPPQRIQWTPEPGLSGSERRTDSGKSANTKRQVDSKRRACLENQVDTESSMDSQQLAGMKRQARRRVEGGLTGQQLSVVQAWGPERIETGWWRGFTVCRDYWRVETDAGQQLWIYRDLRSGRWYLQGQF